VTVLTAGTLASSPPFNSLLAGSAETTRAPVRGRSASFRDGAKPCIYFSQNFCSNDAVRDERSQDQIRRGDLSMISIWP
jgi:hypothetical protein